ncbi:hypothetical protein LDENG_00113060 [Lucifuga dentata]|nr:hypothetical protein LDENG_00113060 [Lucifuga dentata]
MRTNERARGALYLPDSEGDVESQIDKVIKALVRKLSITWTISLSCFPERDQTIQQRRKLLTSRGNMRRRRIYTEIYMDIFKNSSRASAKSLNPG